MREDAEPSGKVHSTATTWWVSSCNSYGDQNHSPAHNYTTLHSAYGFMLRALLARSSFTSTSERCVPGVVRRERRKRVHYMALLDCSQREYGSPPFFRRLKSSAPALYSEPRK